VHLKLHRPSRPAILRPPSLSNAVRFSILAVVAILAILKEVSKQPDLLTQTSGFIGRYLQCSEHQRTVLALWVLHTYCYSSAQVAPYLSIQSAHKQSGKTLCLQLLNLLCAAPAFTSGFTTSALTRRLRGPVATLLLDECHATLGTRARSKAPALRAVLAGGFHRGLGCMVGPDESSTFCPKAFAGMGQLPEALADRAIPIILEPLKASASAERVSRSPDHLITCDHPMVERFHLHSATAEAKPLRQRLLAWAEAHRPHLQEMLPYNQDAFPPNFSPRRQDLCEPLLQLADAIGGEWPARIRQALVGVFEEQSDFDLQPHLQLLADLHQCFFHYGFPERLSTAVLLDWLHALPARPWDIDGPLSARSLARLLVAFEIRPRLQRNGSARPARGYELKDFLQSWQRHLGLAGPYPSQNPAARPANKPAVTGEHSSEIASKDAGCNTSTGARALSLPGYPGKANGSQPGSLSLVTGNLSPVVCNGLTDGGAVPVSTCSQGG
jgi:hypothetical protein